MSIMMKRRSLFFDEQEDDQDVYSAKQIIFDQLTKLADKFNSDQSSITSFREAIDNLVDIVPEADYGPYKMNGTPKVTPLAIVDEPNLVVYQMIDAPKQIKIAFRNSLQGILFELSHTECVKSLPALFDIDTDYDNEEYLGCIVCKFTTSELVSEGLLDGIGKAVDNITNGTLAYSLSHGVEKDGEYWSEDIQNYNATAFPGEAVTMYAVYNPDKFIVTGSMRDPHIYCGKLGMKELGTKFNLYSFRIKSRSNPIMSDVQLLASGTYKELAKKYKVPLFQIKDTYSREKAAKATIEAANKVMKDYKTKNSKIKYVINDSDKFEEKIKYNPTNGIYNLTLDLNVYCNYYPKQFIFLYVEGLKSRTAEDKLGLALNDEIAKRNFPYSEMYADVSINSMTNSYTGEILATAYSIDPVYKAGRQYQIEGSPIK